MADKQNLGIEDVREFLKQKGFENEIVELTDSARTAQLAAEAIGTSVAQIVKSLIFKGSQSGAPILVLASGANRVDEKKVAQVIGEPIKKADADFVRARTGFAIGGVPPFAHLEPMRTVIDEDLLTFADIWSAAGHPHSRQSRHARHADRAGAGTPLRDAGGARAGRDGGQRARRRGLAGRAVPGAGGGASADPGSNCDAPACRQGSRHRVEERRDLVVPGSRA